MAVTAAQINEKIVVLGLGYVGLPVAVAFARVTSDIVGFDISNRRIESLSGGSDWTGEVSNADLKASKLQFSADPEVLNGASFIVVTVPTPIDAMRRPDLSPIEGACRLIGPRLAKGAIVVFESTVYPGVTEDVCGPLLAELSGLRPGVDFFLAYSPERINPGDKVRRLETITKIIAADTSAALDRVRAVYGAIIEAGLHEAPSIRVAEAAKVIENAQRDINIAFMNEVTRIFAQDGISIWDVLDAAGTKWNFLPFSPGLVGGHCIGVDPYYLSHKAEMLGHDPQVILSGRAINDDMGRWIADRLHDELGRQSAHILIMGLTFKENVPDLRNSKVADVIARLLWLGHNVTVHDPHADHAEAVHEYDIALDDQALAGDYDAVFVAVAHREYGALSYGELEGLIRPGGVLFDFKRLWPDLAAGRAAFSDGRRYKGL